MSAKGQVLPVSIGDIVVSKSKDDVLVAYGLGSCVAVCLYDPVQNVAGMVHALLPAPPNSANGNGNGNGHGQIPGKFVSSGVPALLEEMAKHGANKSRLRAWLCGGANVLTAPGFNGLLNIGDRNIKMAHKVLKTVNMPLKAESVGGNFGRTVRLFVNDGQITVKTLGQGEQIL